MENSKIKEQLINANNSKLKYISLISLGFSVYALITDFLFQGIWNDEYLNIYKVLDIVLTILSVSAISFFWLFKIKNITIQKTGIILFPFLFLIWSAVITGVDFSMLGFSTFIIVVLFITFFLFLNPIVSIVYFSSACLVLMIVLYFTRQLNDNYLSLIFLIIPTVTISVLITVKNYKNKLNDLFNKEVIEGINQKLHDSNKNLEREVEKRTKEIMTALKKAEESDKLKSAFLANMSHEIRTPMNGILGFAELLKEPDLTGEQRQEYIRIIEKGGVRMLNIINDIVDISKIESGLMKVSISETNVNDQIGYLYKFFKTEAENKGLQLFSKNNLTDAIIFTDREKLDAILTNLIKNAIKFCEKGIIEIGYEIVEHDRASIRFYVKDTGIGIPNDRQEAIFERFIQADIVDKMARQGAGLGLAISKAYVEMLGGKIWVESEVGKGSTFYFTLPYYAEPEEKKDFHKVVIIEDQENPVNPEVSGLKILIAEDDEKSANFLSILMRKSSKEVLKVRTGVDAIEICRNNPDIDLVLMDIQMPEMDGYEATRLIRQFNTKVVIIAQTAYALAGDREKALESGCNDYLSKPIKRIELMELIEKHFKKKQ